MNRGFGNLTLFVLLLVLLSCESSNESVVKTNDSIRQTQSTKERIYYSGQADKPASDSQITSAGLGKLILGDSLEKILRILQPLTKRIEDKVYYEEGKEWPSKIVYLNNGYYISLSMVNTIDLVTTIHTNDPSFSSRNGIRVGLSLDSINMSLDSIKSDYEHKAFTIGEEGVWFKVNKKEESNYFKTANPTLTYPKGAKIVELFVVCGDC